MCVYIQKALLFFSSLPCGLFCCLFCLFQSGSCVWTAGKEMHLAPLCEFRSCYDELSVGFDPEMERSSECHTETSQSKSSLSLYLSFVVYKDPSSVTI